MADDERVDGAADIGVVEAGDDGRVRPPRGMLTTYLDGLTPLVMVNNLADETTDCDKRMSSESRSTALMLEEVIALLITKALGIV